MSQNSPKILVVDDCQNICNALKRLLRFNGFEFYSAPLAKDGLVLLKEDGPFVAVIADYYMPQMVGVTFLQEVKRLWPDCFGILLTAFIECPEIEAAVEGGFTAAVMAKPWDDEKLIGTLEQAVELCGAMPDDVRAKGRLELAQQVTYAQRMERADKSRHNCWEFMSCGREPGGDKVEELGVCKATLRLSGSGLGATGRPCWAVEGTLSGGEVQCTSAQKHGTCPSCAFYQQVMGLSLPVDQMFSRS